jgi:hypothetical protein
MESINTLNFKSSIRFCYILKAMPRLSLTVTVVQQRSSNGPLESKRRQQRLKESKHFSNLRRLVCKLVYELTKRMQSLRDSSSRQPIRQGSNSKKKRKGRQTYPISAAPEHVYDASHKRGLKASNSGRVRKETEDDGEAGDEEDMLDDVIRDPVTLEVAARARRRSARRRHAPLSSAASNSKARLLRAGGIMDCTRLQSDLEHGRARGSSCYNGGPNFTEAPCHAAPRLPPPPNPALRRVRGSHARRRVGPRQRGLPPSSDARACAAMGNGHP